MVPGCRAHSRCKVNKAFAAHHGGHQLSSVCDLHPVPGGHKLQAPGREKLALHERAQALPVGHPQRQQPPLLS